MYSGMFNIAYKNIGSNFNHWIVRVFFTGHNRQGKYYIIGKEGEDTHESSSNSDVYSKR